MRFHQIGIDFFGFSWSVRHSQYTRYTRKKNFDKNSAHEGDHSPHVIGRKVNCVGLTSSKISENMCDSSELKSIFRIFVIGLAFAIQTKSEKKLPRANEASIDITVHRTISGAMWVAWSGCLQRCLTICAITVNWNRFFGFLWWVWHSKYTVYRRNKYFIESRTYAGHHGLHFLGCKVSCVTWTSPKTSENICDYSESESNFRIFAIGLAFVLHLVSKTQISGANEASVQVTIHRSFSDATWVALSGRLLRCLIICVILVNWNRFFGFLWSVWHLKFTNYRRNDYFVESRPYAGPHGLHFPWCNVSCVTWTSPRTSENMCDSIESESIFLIFVFGLAFAIHPVSKTRKYLVRMKLQYRLPFIARSRM